MKVAYVAAGAAGAYCGACARDTAVVRGLRARGHDVEFIALYTPLRADRMPKGKCPIFFGGINVYLQQRIGLFRHTPALMDRIFDSAWLLDFVEKFAIDTRPEDLGAMAVSVLRGADGRQKKELARLVRHLARKSRPDVVNITNSLLSAIAPAVKQAMGARVVCNLQGEDVFVERLGSPWAEEAIRLIRRNAEAVDVFVAPSDGYADAMTSFLGVPRERIRVIRPGIDTALYAPRIERPAEPFQIGYLSRIAASKGIDLLCDAFQLMEAERPGASRLDVAGEAVGADAEMWRTKQQQLRDAGLGERFRYVGAPDLEGKVAFLHGLSVFSVPSRLVERQSVAVLEAMATGCPVVLPNQGIEREILALTSGGIAVRPGDAGELTLALTHLRDNPAERALLGRNAAEGIARHFSETAMVDATANLYESLTPFRP